LRLGTDDAIGVVIDSVADPFFASVTGAIERIALDRDIPVTIASVRRQPQLERRIIESLARRKVAGLIVTPIDDDHSYLASAPFPMVFVDRRPVNLDADVVVVDDCGGAQQAVSHLIAHGHRRIAFLGDVPELPTSRDRLLGYRRALAGAGITPIERYVMPQCREIPDAARLTATLLDMAEPPTAIFSSNTRCSLGVVPVLHSRDRTGVAFVGFGDFSMADSLLPGITVIDHSPEEIGRLAAEQLFARLDGDSSETVVLSPALHLIVRGSGELRP
jgi:LacI family transcriptional regulator